MDTPEEPRRMAACARILMNRPPVLHRAESVKAIRAEAQNAITTKNRNPSGVLLLRNHGSLPGT